MLPLGASPYSADPVPGYPLVMFQLNAVELLAGADVGISMGVMQQSDSFFLSYAGMKAIYNPTRTPFDPTIPGSGFITKLELGDWTLYDVNRDPQWRDSDGETLMNPEDTLITVVTNLYLAGFLDAFGLTPRDADGEELALWETVLCRTGQNAECGVDLKSIDYCGNLSTGASPPWQDVPHGELKEWSALLLCLTVGLAKEIPAVLYAGEAPANPRVIAETP